jgi:carboxypeptidase C (cathepsin A)
MRPIDKSRLAMPLFAVVAALAGMMPISQLAAQDAQAQPTPQQQQGRRSNQPAGDTSAPQATTARQLPADSVTQHTIELPGRTLKFTATAGSIPIRSAEGRLQAEIAYITYALAGADSKLRPVTFALNGGPGSASAWVHLGGFGPWRVAMDAASVSPSAPPELLANAETWLDFTDLVFIDPVGTGFSRIARATGEAPAAASSTSASSSGGREGGSGGRNFYSVNGDVDSLSEMVHLWLRKHNRLASPKMLVGESYAGLRAPKIAHTLQTSYGAGLNAIVMLSPVLDYAMLRGNRNNPFSSVIQLPSIAAAARQAKGEAVSRATLADAETYARGEYFQDIMKGPRDAAAVERMIKRVTALSGLSESIIRQLGGRIDSGTYRREANRAAGQTASPYDATVKGIDTDPTAAFSRNDDPFTSGLRAPVTAAMLELYQNRLNWRAEGNYQMSNMDVNRAWSWGNSTSPPEAMSELKSALALDPRMHALITHGFTDLVTPYFMSALLLDQVPKYGNTDRLQLIVYPGGHMYYSREASRIAFRNDIQKLWTSVLPESAKKAP